MPSTGTPSAIARAPRAAIMRSQAGARVALDAGLGDEDRAAVAGIDLGQDAVERPVERVVGGRSAGRRGSTGCCGR